MTADSKLAYESPDPERPSAETPTISTLQQELSSKHDPYAALRFRDYRFYSIGWLCASIGFQMQIAAIGWETYKWTGSAMKVGRAGGLQALPLILLPLPSGHIADRSHRRPRPALGHLPAT